MVPLPEAALPASEYETKQTTSPVTPSFACRNTILHHTRRFHLRQEKTHVLFSYFHAVEKTLFSMGRILHYIVSIDIQVRVHSARRTTTVMMIILFSSIRLHPCLCSSLHRTKFQLFQFFSSFTIIRTLNSYKHTKLGFMSFSTFTYTKNSTRC